MTEGNSLLAEDVQLRTQPKPLQTGDVGQMTAAVAGSSVVAFAGQLTPQQRADVLDSTLFAQFRSTHKHNPFDEPPEWYNEYATVLGLLGWRANHVAFSEVPVPKRKI